MAQYALGHAERIAAVKRRLAQHSMLFLAGDWIGISDCIRSGRAAAAECLRNLAPS